MKIVDISAAARYSDEKLQKVSLFDSERFFCDLYCLEPGQRQQVHVHAAEGKVYVVLEGQATITIGGEEAVITQGQAVHAPAGVEHGVVNAAPMRLRMLVFMAPRPKH